jgi:ABC-2 type transport system permease protein
VAFTMITGGPWPLLLAVTPALLGGGAGMVPLVSVYGLVPGIDPRNRGGNPLRTSEDDGTLTGMAYLMLVLVALTAAPAIVVALMFGWWGVPVGVATGVLSYWGLGLLAERRLTAQGSELLQLMRTGRRPGSTTSVSAFAMPKMSKAREAVVMICVCLGAIPLIPQGVVAMVMTAQGQLRHSWFLATYMPPGLRWPTAVVMMLIGLAMYVTGFRLWWQAKKSAAREVQEA